MTQSDQHYLGDGVYVYFDGAGIMLYADKLEATTRNMIYLEPEVCSRLAAYTAMIRKKYYEHSTHLHPVSEASITVATSPHRDDDAAIKERQTGKGNRTTIERLVPRIEPSDKQSSNNESTQDADRLGQPPKS